MPEEKLPQSILWGSRRFLEEALLFLGAKSRKEPGGTLHAAGAIPHLEGLALCEVRRTELLPTNGAVHN